MKTPLALFPALFLTILAVPQAHSQQTPISPTSSACGASKADYVVSHDAAQTASTTIPPGKALVHVIETMLDYPFVTKKVNIGLDGTWLGATDAQSHITFLVDAGVHHLCAVYQGHAAGMDDEGHTLLLLLNAEPGKTYYLRYHALFLKDSPGIAFFDQVDEDEGQLLLQTTEHASSVLKK
jgi:hypothetical protein